MPSLMPPGERIVCNSGKLMHRWWKWYVLTEIQSITMECISSHPWRDFGWKSHLERHDIQVESPFWPLEVFIHRLSMFWASFVSHKCYNLKTTLLSHDSSLKPTVSMYTRISNRRIIQTKGLWKYSFVKESIRGKTSQIKVWEGRDFSIWRWPHLCRLKANWA